MPQVRSGYPAFTGDLIRVWDGPITPNYRAYIFVLNVADDGTRRILRGEREAGGHRFLVGKPIPVVDGGLWSAEYNGLVAVTGLVGGNPSYTSEEYRAGLFLSFADDVGTCTVQSDPVTPGNDFYRFRRILGDHALRYVAEHDPGTLRFADPHQKRINTISHELTDENRVKAANTDEFTRGTIGQLWGICEGLRVLPPEAADVWHARRDYIDSVLAPFCAVCEGEGMSHRTMRGHPSDDWEKWQKAGLRFTVDRDFNANVWQGAGVVTPSRHTADLVNYRHALDWAAEGYADDDYLAPRSVITFGAGTPTMPAFEGDHAMMLSYLVAGWHNKYRVWKETPPEGYDPGIVRSWCVMNLLAILDPRNLASDTVRQAMEDNYLFPLFSIWATNFNVFLAPFNAYTASFEGGFFRSINNHRNMNQITDVYLTDGTDLTAVDSIFKYGGPWVSEAERDARLDKVDQVLGDATPRGVTT